MAGRPLKRSRKLEELHTKAYELLEEINAVTPPWIWKSQTGFAREFVRAVLLARALYVSLARACESFRKMAGLPLPAFEDPADEGEAACAAASSDTDVEDEAEDNALPEKATESAAY